MKKIHTEDSTETRESGEEGRMYVYVYMCKKILDIE